MAGLTTASASGNQTATQSPQTSVSAGTAGTQTGSVQPGTATGLLNGQGGLALHTTALPTVNLNTFHAPATASPSTAAKQQHANSTLIGLAILLVIIAVGCTWVFSRQVKSTTV